MKKIFVILVCVICLAVGFSASSEKIVDGVRMFINAILVSPDIDGGTIDNTVIGGDTPRAGSFTNVTTDATSAPGSSGIDSDTDDPDIIGKDYWNASATGSNVEVGDKIWQVMGGAGTAGALEPFMWYDGNTRSLLLVGALQVNSFSPIIKKYTITTDNTDGVGTHTIAELLGGLIRRGTGDQISGAVIDVTDTAANIVAGIIGCVIGSGFEFTIQNEDSTHTIQLDGGAGVTVIPNDPSTAIPANSSGRFLLEVTNITGAAEAVNIHALGFTTH